MTACRAGALQPVLTILVITTLGCATTPTPKTITRFLLSSLAGVIAAPIATEAKQAAKIARIGYLGGAVGNRPNRDAFLQGLREPRVRRGSQRGG